MRQCASGVAPVSQQPCADSCTCAACAAGQLHISSIASSRKAASRSTLSSCAAHTSRPRHSSSCQWTALTAAGLPDRTSGGCMPTGKAGRYLALCVSIQTMFRQSSSTTCLQSARTPAVFGCAQLFVCCCLVTGHPRLAWPSIRANRQCKPRPHHNTLPAPQQASAAHTAVTGRQGTQNLARADLQPQRQPPAAAAARCITICCCQSAPTSAVHQPVTKSSRVQQQLTRNVSHHPRLLPQQLQWPTPAAAAARAPAAASAATATGVPSRPATAANLCPSDIQAAALEA